MTFTQLPTTRKGAVGEAIAKTIIERSGWLVYESTADVPHLVDFICYKPGKRLIAVDVKTYPRRYCCENTGIDTRDFEKYSRFEESNDIDVYIIFIDEFERAIYGGYLRHLGRRAQHDAGKVYFPLSAMRLHRYLTADELDSIRTGTTPARYRHTKQFFNNNK